MGIKLNIDENESKTYIKCLLKIIMMQHCIKEKEIDKLKEGVSKINDSIHGNGGLGLKGHVIKLEETVKNIDNTLIKVISTNEKTTTVLNGLLKFQTEWEAKEEEREKHKMKMQRKKTNNHWIIGLLVTVILSLISILVL